MDWGYQEPSRTPDFKLSHYPVSELTGSPHAACYSAAMRSVGAMLMQPMTLN
jgi:hypothetical protein